MAAAHAAWEDASGRLSYVGRRLWQRRPLTRLVGVLLVFNTLLALLDYFLTGPGWGFAQWEARRRLTRALGPARYDVRLYACWADLLLGHVPAQIIRARNLKMKDGLVVDDLEVRIQGLSMFNGTITRLDALHFRATVSEDALNDYLPIRPHRPGFEPPLVLILTPGHVEVRIAVFGYSKRVTSGTLEILKEDDTKLQYASAVVTRTVLDLSPSPMGIHLRDFRVLQGRIEVSGTASPRLPLNVKALETPPASKSP